MIGDKQSVAVPQRGVSTRRAFSITELLVVVAIFSIGSLAISATYINFTRLHRRVANAEALGEDMRFVMEALVRASRNNTVPYPSLPTALASPTSTVGYQTDTPGYVLYAARLGSSHPGCAGLNASCLAATFDNGATWLPITGKNVDITRFDVYITPTRSPFQSTGVGTYDNNNHPRTTYVIDATYLATSTREQANISVQTSVASRIYLR